MFVFSQILGDMFEIRCAGISASHYPLGDVEAGAGEISVTVYIYDPADRTTVNAHSNLQSGCTLSTADFDCALAGASETW